MSDMERSPLAVYLLILFLLLPVGPVLETCLHNLGSASSQMAFESSNSASMDPADSLTKLREETEEYFE